MIQFNKAFSFFFLVCCILVWLPATSLNQDAINSIRRARSTNNNSTDESWCTEYITVRGGSFEIHKQLRDMFNINTHPQVSILVYS